MPLNSFEGKLSEWDEINYKLIWQQVNAVRVFFLIRKLFMDTWIISLSGISIYIVLTLTIRGQSIMSTYGDQWIPCSFYILIVMCGINILAV